MKGFIIYSDYMPFFERLSDTSIGVLIRSVSEYPNSGKLTNCPIAGTEYERLAFMELYSLIIDDIDRGTRRKSEVSQARSRAGKASGCARRAKKGGAG